MSKALFNKLLSEHEKLLFHRGYDEKSLNSPFKSGWLVRELKQYLGWAIRQMFWDDSPVDFVLKPVGFFNNEQEIVQFQLKYSFDPATESLSINELVIKYDGLEKAIKLSSNVELPSSHNAIRLVQAQRQITKRKKLSGQRIIISGEKAKGYKKP